MARHQQTMSRAARTARGTAGAIIAALFAGTSHGLAGGVITPISLIATAALSLPLFVALAGRVASLWRLAVGVTFSQFLYHWTFAGLGLSYGSGGDVDPMLGPHAAHLQALSFAPDLLVAGSADLLMWLSHGIAAVITTALIHRGERAAVRLARLILRALPHPLPATIAIPARVPVALPARTPLRLRATPLTPITYRGPPASSFSHH